MKLTLVKEALKNATIQLLSQSDNNVQRLFHVMNAGNTFGDEASKKIAGFLKVKQNVDMSKVQTNRSVNEKLVPPGKVFHMYKKTPKSKLLVMEESDKNFFTEIIISNSMYLDHMPTAYESAFKSVLENANFE
jgi:Ran GTPase-activating protein (RanGAP) involved in mRNA processing and transport